jgi:hypothetical protein
MNEGATVVERVEVNDSERGGGHCVPGKKVTILAKCLVSQLGERGNERKGKA